MANNKGIAKARKEQRRKEAQERQEAHEKLTPEQKLAKLDKAGHKASKERKKLQQQIAKK